MSTVSIPTDSTTSRLLKIGPNSRSENPRSAISKGKAWCFQDETSPIDRGFDWRTNSTVTDCRKPQSIFGVGGRLASIVDVHDRVHGSASNTTLAQRPQSSSLEDRRW